MNFSVPKKYKCQHFVTSLTKYFKPWWKSADDVRPSVRMYVHAKNVKRWKFTINHYIIMSDLSNHIFSESTIHRRFEMTKTMTNTQIHKLEVLERPIMCSYLKFVMSAVSGARVKFLTECKKIPEGRENYCFGQQWMYHFKLSVTLGVWYHPWRVILHLMGRLYM